MKNYGIQLYSVKEHMAASVETTLKEIAAMGYRAVEPAGFFGKTAAEFKAICDENGLTVCGSHNGFGDLLNGKVADTVAYFQGIGCRRLIIAGAPAGTRAELAETIRNLNTFQPILAEAGIELMYHNHSGEFLPNADGQIPHIEMQKHTSIRFEIDVYWAYRGGVSPLYLLEQLKDRVGVIHLKDGTMEHDTPLGRGEVPVAAIVRWAEANGVEMVVENEPVAAVEMTEAKECIDHLLQLS